MPGIYGGMDGTGGNARLNGPSGVAVDSSGNLYLADTGNCTIRKVTPAGVVTTLAGLATYVGSADGTGSLARFWSPRGVAVDSLGNVYVADTGNNTIRKVTPAGVVTTLAAGFNYPAGVAVDGAGSVYVADTFNSVIRVVTAAGTVRTLAGGFQNPYGVAVDGTSNVYVADTGNCTIRKVTPAGVVTTLAGLAGSSGSADGTGSDARFSGPSGVAVDSLGNVYVADTLNSTIRMVTPAGVVTTLAGLAGSTGAADGNGSDARFTFPPSVAVNSAGNLYVADSRNNTIREATPAGACAPHAARAMATVVNGFVVGADITDGGCGYTNVPAVSFQGGGGTGATATAVVSNGVVVNITITSTGAGYSSEFDVYIDPPFDSVPADVPLGLYAGLTMSGAVGRTFGIQYATSLTGTNNWTGITTFTLTQPEQLWVDTSVNARGGTARFYRVVPVP